MPEAPPPPLWKRLADRYKLSLPMVAAIAVGVLLLLIAAVAVVRFALDPHRVAWRTYFHLDHLIALALLWGIACLTTYWSLRLWMREVPLPKGSLAADWHFAEQWLASHAIHIKQRPIFLVFGCWSKHLQSELIPENHHAPSPDNTVSSPLGVCYTDSAVYLFVRHIGSYGAFLNESRTSKANEQRDTPSPVPLTASSNVPANSPGTDEPAPISESLQSVLEEDDTNAAEPPTLDLPSTSLEDVNDEVTELTESSSDTWPQTNLNSHRANAASSTSSTLSKTTSPSNSTEAINTFKTLDRVDALVEQAQDVSADVLQTAILSPQRQPTEATTSINSVALAEAQAQLRILAKLLVDARHPQAPINGALVLASYEQLSSPSTVQLAGKAIREDVELVQAELGLEFPVTTLLVDADSAEDYRQLARTLDHSIANTEAGKRQEVFPLGSETDCRELPTTVALQSLLNRSLNQLRTTTETLLCENPPVEDENLYRIFKPLLRWQCKRSEIRSLLVEAYGHDRPADGSAPAPLVAGLFFAGDIACSVQKRFVRGVTKHLLRQQHFLQWTSAARRQQERLQRIQMGLTVAATLLFAVLIMQLVMQLVS